MMRVATFATQQLSLAQQMRTQAEWERVSFQASSGKTSSDYMGIALDSHRLISLENLNQTVDGYLSNIDITELRLSSIETNVAATFDVASKVRSLLVQSLNATNAEVAATNENASIMLDEVVSLLNLELDGRYLFGGTVTDRPPVDLAAFDPDDAGYDPANPVPANMGYYQGNDSALTARIDDDILVDYGVTANESGFEALLRGLYLASTANTTPGAVDTARLEEALTLTNQAIQEIPIVQSRVGAMRARLEDTRTTHVELQLLAENEIGAIENVDVVQTMTKVSALQLQLEASYMITAQMANVSLASYLR